MENLSYEDASKKLNKIIEALEEGNLPMEKAIEYFDEGQKLIKICYDALNKAKGKLTEIKENLDNIEEV